LISYRKMPVDERLMNRECEYILESRTESYFASRLRRRAHRYHVQGYRRQAVLCEVGSVSCLRTLGGNTSFYSRPFGNIRTGVFLLAVDCQRQAIRLAAPAKGRQSHFCELLRNTGELVI